MNSSTRRARRKADVKQRAQLADWDGGRCVVIDCPNAARSATGEGLDTRFCRTHADQYARHGSPYRKSYTAAQVRPYRAAAKAWLKTHKDDPWVLNGLERVRGLYSSAGQHIEAFRLRGLPVDERARVAWARLRKASVDPVEVLVAALAMEMLIRDDPQSDRKTEFKEVQTAKLVHRMASGSHQKWGDGPTTKELHFYPRSRGRVLRHIGRAAMEACELIIGHHLTSIPTITFRQEATQAK